MAGGATESGRSVTSKVTAILMVFSHGGAYSLTELAQLAGLPVSTAHRLAGELAARRVLERTEDGGYRIGLPLRMIGSGAGGAAPAAPPPLLDCAAMVVVDLTVATRAPVRIGTLDGAVVLDALARPGDPVPTRLGPAGRPAATTALGRALLAFSPPSVVDEVLAGGPVPERLRRSLGVTRLTRFAVSRGGAGAGAVAMPVFGAGGLLIAALELEIADMQNGLRSARAALAVAAGSLSRQLAAPGPVPAAAAV